MENQLLKRNINWISLGLAYVAITAVQISYLLSGIKVLDLFLVLIIPAFLLMIVNIILECFSGSKEYCVSFALLIACVLVSLSRLYAIAVGIIGDQYHTFKVVAFSIKNSFFTQLQIQPFMQPILISDFIESIWGIFWRLTHWDFTTVLLQALPIILV